MKNVKQHYLPAGFLKHFSEEPDLGRGAPVHVFNGSKSFLTKVGAICAESDFYGYERDTEFMIHGELENGLFATLNSLLSGDDTSKIMSSMLVHTSYLHIRGPEFQNLSSASRLTAAQNLGVVHLCQHILGMSSSEVSDQYGPELAKNVRDRIELDWNCKLLSPSSSCADPTLFCSDSPALFFTDNQNANLIVLPISSERLFVAAKRTDYNIVTTEYAEVDAAWANAAQCWFSVRHLISKKKLSSEEEGLCGKKMGEAFSERSKFEDGDLVITRKELGANLPSFIQPV